MKREEIQAALDQIREALHQEFEDESASHASRLEQVDHALANAATFADYLFDEEEREVDLAIRVMNDEASSPVAGRTKKDYYAKVARRAR